MGHGDLWFILSHPSRKKQERGEGGAPRFYLHKKILQFRIHSGRLEAITARTACDSSSRVA